MDQVEQSQIRQPSESAQKRIRIDRTAGFSSYNLFCKELCAGDPEIKKKSRAERFALFGQRWSQLSGEEKRTFAKKAARKPLSLAERDRLWKLNLRKMKRLMDYQKELVPSTEGFFVIAQEANAEIVGGTPGGMRFVEQSRALVDNFASVPALWAEPSQKITVKQIRDLFNVKYAAVAGPGKRLPYSKGTVLMTGLPDGLVLRRPAQYGTKQLRRIWEARDSIAVAINE